MYFHLFSIEKYFLNREFSIQWTAVMVRSCTFKKEETTYVMVFFSVVLGSGLALLRTLINSDVRALILE